MKLYSVLFMLYATEAVLLGKSLMRCQIIALNVRLQKVSKNTTAIMSMSLEITVVMECAYILFVSKLLDIWYLAFLCVQFAVRLCTCRVLSL